MINKGIKVFFGVQKNCWRCREKAPHLYDRIMDRID